VASAFTYGCWCERRERTPVLGAGATSFLGLKVSPCIESLEDFAE
jgi:hypothetical protein